MKYLGIESQRPKIGVFDFTGCEGCELQLANKEETLAAFLGCIDVVCFREISSASGVGFTIALVEGAISREDEVERIQWIREQAEVLVALGSCACFGGVNRLKNAFDLDEANREVYGDQPKPTRPVRHGADFGEWLGFACALFRRNPHRAGPAASVFARSVTGSGRRQGVWVRA